MDPSGVMVMSSSEEDDEETDDEVDIPDPSDVPDLSDLEASDDSGADEARDDHDSGRFSPDQTGMMKMTRNQTREEWCLPCTA